MKQQILYRDEKTGRYVKAPVRKKIMGACDNFNQNCKKEDELVKEAIKEYLQDNAEILPEEKPKDILYITDWFFNTGIKVLFMVLIYVVIWYVGVRV